MLCKCCMQYTSKFGRLSSHHRTGKVQFSFQSWRKAMPKNAQTTAQLHSSHTLASECSKFSKQDFNSMWIEISTCSAEFRKGRGTRDQNPNICWVIRKARDFQKKTYISFIEHAKAFDCVDGSKLWESLQERGIPEHLNCLLRNLYACQEATVRARHGMMD